MKTESRFAWKTKMNDAFGANSGGATSACPARNAIPKNTRWRWQNQRQHEENLAFFVEEPMKTEIEEKIVMRMLFYPATNQVVAHLYDAGGHLKYRAAVDAHEVGNFRATVAHLLAALGVKVASDATL